MLLLNNMAGSFRVSYFGAVVAAMLLISTKNGGGATTAQAVQHVVGDDHGWDISSNVAAWAINKIFRVGDNIWFAYSAAEENVIELQKKEEFESCNLSNPIEMYTNGLDKVSLNGEGARYFTSGKLEKCKKGLKLQVEVMPRAKTGEQAMPVSSNEMVFVDRAVASAPEASCSNHLKATYLLCIALAISLGILS